MSIFGAPLMQSVPPGASMPPQIEQLLKVIACIRPVDPSLFDLPMNHPKVAALKTKVDTLVTGPFDEEDNPQVLAALLLLFLHQLPHPLVPPRMYATAMKVASVCATHTRLKLLRAFMAKLPSFGRGLTLQLLVSLCATGIDPMRLAALFTPYILRANHNLLGPDGSCAADYGVVCLVAEMIAHAEYISLSKQEPAAVSGNNITEQTSEFMLLASAVSDFSSNGTVGLLALRAGDSVQIMDAHPNGWLEACVNGEIGFIPEGYVEIVPVVSANTTKHSAPQAICTSASVQEIPNNNATQKPSWVLPHHPPSVNSPSPLQSSSVLASSPPSQELVSPRSSEFSPAKPKATSRSFSTRSLSSPITPICPPPSQTSLKTSQDSPPRTSYLWTSAHSHNSRETDNFRNYRSTSDGNTTRSNLSINLTRTKSSMTTQSTSTTPTNTTPTPVPPTGLSTSPSTFNPPPPLPPPSTALVGLPSRPTYAAPSPQLSKTYSDGNPVQEGWDEIKVVVIGTGGVGKSCFTVCFVQNDFLEEYDPTLEDSYRKQFVVDDRVCFLKILDTAGQEEYSSLRDQYMRQGQGFIMMCSLICRESLESLPALAEALLKVKDSNTLPPTTLVANKCDLAPSLYEITTHEVMQMGEQLDVPVFVSSAKLHKNVDEVFVALVRQVRTMELRVEKPKRSVCCIL